MKSIKKVISNIIRTISAFFVVYLWLVILADIIFLVLLIFKVSIHPAIIKFLSYLNIAMVFLLAAFFSIALIEYIGELRKKKRD